VPGACRWQPGGGQAIRSLCGGPPDNRKGKNIAVTVTYFKLPNRLVSAANGIDYAYRRGRWRGSAGPAPALPRQSRQLGSAADRRAGGDPARPDLRQHRSRRLKRNHAEPRPADGPAHRSRLPDRPQRRHAGDRGLRAARTIAAARALAPFRDKELFPGAGRRHRRRLPRLPAQHHHHFRACSPASRPLRHDRTQAARSQKGPGTCRHGHPGCSETQVRSVR
jgi:hypothetical protein